MSKLRQAGFTAVEAIVAVVIIVALVGVGIWVMNRQTNESKQDDTFQTADVQQNTEAPAVETTADLDAAEKSLDESNLNAGAADNEDLTQELGAF